MAKGLVPENPLERRQWREALDTARKVKKDWELEGGDAQADYNARAELKPLDKLYGAGASEHVVGHFRDKAQRDAANRDDGNALDF